LRLRLSDAERLVEVVVDGHVLGSFGLQLPADSPELIAELVDRGVRPQLARGDLGRLARLPTPSESSTRTIDDRWRSCLGLPG
jgi:hypothetical protein